VTSSSRAAILDAALRQAEILPAQPPRHPARGRHPHPARGCPRPAAKAVRSRAGGHFYASAEKVWIQTHFNHPREITTGGRARLQDPASAPACPLTTTRVLLNGCQRRPRDHVAGSCGPCCVSRLFVLLPVPLRPPSTGAGHFRTSVWKGLELMEGLARPHVRSGHPPPTWGQPATAAARFRSLPNYLVSASDDCVILRNYEGMLVATRPKIKEATVRPAIDNRGVSQLIEGGKTVSCPRNNERMARAQGPQEAARQGREERRRLLHDPRALRPTKIRSAASETRNSKTIGPRFGNTRYPCRSCPRIDANSMSRDAAERWGHPALRCKTKSYPLAWLAPSSPYPISCLTRRASRR